MKYRPPVRTTEIEAWNWGARGRAAGLLPADLEPLGEFPPRLVLTPAGLEALARLGPDAFHKWALRGWVESPPVEEA